MSIPGEHPYPAQPRVRALEAWAAALCLMAWLGGGCAAYTQDRLKDASEMFECGAGLSQGCALNLRVTKLAQAGVGSATGVWAGLREGRFSTWEEERSELGVTPLFYHEVFRESRTLIAIRHPLLWDPGYAPFFNDLFLITDRGFFEVGISATLVLIGMDLSFELAEVADFVTGIAGFDILADDAFAVSESDLVKQLQSRNAWKRYAAARALRRATGAQFGYVLYTVRDEHTEEQVQAGRRWRAWLAERGRGDAAESAGGGGEAP